MAGNGRYQVHRPQRERAKDVEGRTLTVNETRPKTDRPGEGGFGRKRW
jgi:hypothetical protein